MEDPSGSIVPAAWQVTCCGVSDGAACRPPASGAIAPTPRGRGTLGGVACSVYCPHNPPSPLTAVGEKLAARGSAVAR